MTAGAGAASVVTAPALTGIATGVVEGAIVAGSAEATVAGSAAAGAVSGATGSAAVGGAAIGSASAGAAGLTAGIASGPVGWLILGADKQNATFDCWKLVLRDESNQLSNGKLLRDILSWISRYFIEDQRIKRIVVEESRNEFNLPELSLVNILDEQFNINYVVLPFNSQLVAHADKFVWPKTSPIKLSTIQSISN